jgi:hypothetical protein
VKIRQEEGMEVEEGEGGSKEMSPPADGFPFFQVFQISSNVILLLS